ncbi:hypothetical protein AAFF_G00069130 [Aldrovandia affinis]|uniref:Uncharacterized protein n=1 Tax=Aldrovandia affinis TaxID=143900 RepID=A0AAD7RZ37_9TELE|nr:hypothetical protein AAFF_G00069130 [Aldrovandia affinis]
MARAASGTPGAGPGSAVRGRAVVFGPVIVITARGLGPRRRSGVPAQIAAPISFHLQAPTTPPHHNLPSLTARPLPSFLIHSSEVPVELPGFPVCLNVTPQLSACPSVRPHGSRRSPFFAVAVSVNLRRRFWFWAGCDVAVVCPFLSNPVHFGLSSVTCGR